MGLDQYASWIDTTSNNPEKQEFKYWRKVNHIQNWMQQLYAKKTGDTVARNFNCIDLELTKEDIDTFVNDVVNKKLQCTNGFFFGSEYDTTSPEVMEEDLDFAMQAMKHIYMGRKVIYGSWW